MSSNKSWPNLEGMLKDKAFLFIPLIIGVAIYYPLSKAYEFARFRKRESKRSYLKPY